MPAKRPNRGGFKGDFKKLKRKQKAIQEGSPEEVLLADIRELLAISADDAAAADVEPDAETLPAPGTEIEVDVFELSSNSDGLARQEGSRRIYAVPYTLPGDKVKVKVYKHLTEEQYSIADFVAVTKPSASRDDSRITCPYFTKCPGCQFQMLEYADQLQLKKRMVEKAYRHFSDLPPGLVPRVLDTMGSPLQYSYRTKLTPHFDGPPRARKGEPRKRLEAMPPVGFTSRQRQVLDIEDCPIGTDAVRKGMTQERERLAREYGNYEKGATILLRESTVRVPKTAEGQPGPVPDGVPVDAVTVEGDSYVDYKTCITDNNATSTEYIDDFVFTNPAGAFFQNNNSILSPFTAYIREHILPPSAPPSAAGAKPIRNLIDAYSGSGLFTITLSSLFATQGGGSTGIDIADKSIAFARRNAALNGLDEAHCRFIAADAPELFRSVAAYDPDETVVVLDPPRKGCDAGFLRQLLAFGPRRVVYVSCNVHTQARDVGVLVRGEIQTDRLEGQKSKAAAGSADEASGPTTESIEGQNANDQRKKTRYEIESLRGFDFFPQTGHVEGVAVLNRVVEQVE
ncbi:hypothetical protein P8C59_000269 [Phyllachora maydis]|uniref:TRAM domain-containing protein n=1 Tax=Phyllachora maydis TaxID=1825666 RepID=A0AAD9HVV1_9PEZI|nr:hypothetical protein P8C59_000269 [Phyllachora maydis]